MPRKLYPSYYTQLSTEIKYFFNNKINRLNTLCPTYDLPGLRVYLFFQMIPGGCFKKIEKNITA